MPSVFSLKHKAKEKLWKKKTLEYFAPVEQSPWDKRISISGDTFVENTALTLTWTIYADLQQMSICLSMPKYCKDSHLADRE